MKYLWAILIALSCSLAGLSLAATSEARPVQNQAADKVYKPDEVTVRAKITLKPEPRYTDEARQNRTSGTVVLEMVLRASGEVTDITVLRGLPHGLTESSIRAAQATKFEPALKDDRKVSQSVRVEYGFRVY